VRLFYSYAHEDEKLRAELERHLKILQHRGLIQPWHDRAIVPGALWDAEIHQQLLQADLVLLLLSSYFMGSDYILGVELKTALRRAAEGSATVVPILLRPLDLDGLDSDDLPMAQLLQRQGLPRDLKAVTSWRQREEAWVNVSKGLRSTVADIQARRAVVGVQAAVVAPSKTMFGTASAAPVADPLLDAVLDNAAAGILAAQQARGGPAPSPAALHRQALALIDCDHLPRVLWVDDHPEGNLAEAEMLARLQIELVQVRSTDEALARLQSDPERFDLVLSDWQRHADGPEACLRLQQALLQSGQGVPLVVYHAAFDTAVRQDRAERARRAGLFGEAVLPGELLALVQAVLRRGKSS
jgi:CheY-like chemotaxis protein